MIDLLTSSFILNNYKYNNNSNFANFLPCIKWNKYACLLVKMSTSSFRLLDVLQKQKILSILFF